MVASTVGLSQHIHVNKAQGIKVNDPQVQTLAEQTGGFLRLGTSSAVCPVLLTADPLESVTNGLMSVNSQLDHDAICKTGDPKLTTFHIVGGITWCPMTQGDEIFGCSDISGSCAMVVWTGDTNQLTISQWLHEFAHTRGRRHRSGPQLLMNEYLNGNQIEVSGRECNQMLGHGNRPLSTPRRKKRAPKAAKPSEDAIAAKPPIKEFVERIYVHGLPLELMRQYTAEDIDGLVALLSTCCGNAAHDCERESISLNIVTMIGSVGRADQTSANTLKKVVESASDDCRWSYHTKTAVPVALGRLLARVKDPQLQQDLFQYLKKGAFPDNWWTTESVQGLDSVGLAEELSKRSILGLGISGNSEAAKFLVELNQVKTPFFQQPTVRALIVRAMELNLNTANELR